VVHIGVTGADLTITGSAVAVAAAGAPTADHNQITLEAALVGGLFHFKSSARCRYWHVADKPTSSAFVAY